MGEWISVKERLPDCGKEKSEDLGWLVFRPTAKTKKVMTMYVHPDWWHTDNGSSQEITHWQPLPTPPKGAD